jgi:heptosyltransferase-2
MPGPMRPLRSPAAEFQQIAVLRLSSLGDVVLTLPTVQALARAFPQAQLTYWVKQEYADLVRFDPSVHHVRTLEADARRLEDVISMSAELEDSDLIVDLHGNGRTRLLTFRQKAPVLRAPSYRWRRAMQVHARALHPKPPPSALARFALALRPLAIAPQGPPRLSVGEEAEAWAAGWMAEWNPRAAPVAMLPAARHFTKRWPEERWLELHDRLMGQGIPLLYASLEAERRSSFRLAAKVAKEKQARWSVEPLARMAALFSHCRAAITSDSGLMHVAAARGVPVVALFGSTAPELGFAPAGDGHAVLCRHEPCQPCTLHGRPACPRRHFRCMIGITTDEVLAALSGLPSRA